ncbi:MAG: hypothetical protein ACR2PM_04305 [Hyphomicrobiales bacterium]
MAAFCLVATLAGRPAQAAMEAKIVATTETDGYARLVLTFPKLPKDKVAVVSGVLVVEFDRPIEFVLGEANIKSPDFIVVGRSDPDRRALRFALAQNIRVNTMEAAAQLYIDLMPASWRGVAPGLPPEVVAELARRAEEAERAADIEARRLALQKSKYKLRIRVGQQPTFSRVVFDWGTKVGVELTRKGNRIIVAFDQFAKPPMERFKVDPPRFIKSAKPAIGKEGLQIELVIDEESDVRGFREENTYVLDVTAPPGIVADDNKPVAGGPGDENEPGASAREVVEFKHDTTEKPQPRAPEKPDASSVAKPKSPAGTPKPVASAAPPKAEPKAPVAKTANAAPGVEVAAQSPAATAKPKPADDPGEELPPTVIVSEFYLNSDATDLAGAPPEKAIARDDDPDAPSDSAVVTADMVPEPEPDAGSEAEPETDVAEAAADDAPDGAVKARIKRSGKTVRLTFPFARRVASAVFRRSDKLWLVFDSDQPIDMSALKPNRKNYIRKVEQVLSGTTRIIRFHLDDLALASASTEGKSWVLTLGTMVVTPSAPVSLKRGFRTDGRAKISIRFQEAAEVHQIKDPEIGDKILVATGYGPQRGMLKAQDFVEFSVLKSAHGIAIRPLADDLRVRLSGDDILITRSGGLTLSSSRVSQLEDDSVALTDTVRPGFVDHAQWSPGGPDEFVARTYQLERTITNLDPSQALGARLGLVRLFLANGLGPEAIGQLALISEADPELKSEPALAALRGIANVLMHRPKEARKDLASYGLKDDPHSALWRGIVESQEERWRLAVDAFQFGERAITDYPPLEQLRFRLAAMRAGIELNDFSTADFHFKLIPNIEFKPEVQAEINVLHGRLLDGLGRSIEAYDLLETTLNSGDPRVDAEAMFYHTLLGSRLKKLSTEETQARLETLAAIWRGDVLELNTLRRLASIYVDHKDYRRALEVMKIAVRNYPKAELSQDIHNDMVALFEKLYLRDKADELKPVDALALYYQYRELTPVGRHGDEMIRKLADRLISVDLLDQAIEILDHQVDKRLIGAARAQVAAKLAMVHLMNRKPARALQVVRRTRQAVLPQHIRSQRRLIEARALSELNRTDAAVDLLANVDGEEAVRMRAEAYWRGERWQNAGETFERVLGEAAQGKEQLSGLQRIDVLRAAISYVLADDEIGLDRLRGKFEKKMSGTPDEEAFVVVTRPLDRNAIAFRNLAREIASIDTLEAFLKKFRTTFDVPGTGADASLQQQRQ